MKTPTTAQQRANAALRAYQEVGRRLPEPTRRNAWTPQQYRELIAARDAYYTALETLNNQRISR